MATRFYTCNHAPAYSPPSWQGGWTATSASASNTRLMDPEKFGYGQTAPTFSEASTTNPYKGGVLRFVSRRLANSQTISGTVTMAQFLRESSASADFYTRLHIYVVDVDTGSVLGTLLNGYEESAGGGGTEWPTTLTARALQAAQSLTSVAIPGSGNYAIVAELGFIAYNAVSTNFTATISHGYFLGTDAVAGDTNVAEPTWFEFSGTITLAADVIQNCSIASAIDVGSLPATITKNVVDGAASFQVTYYFDAPEDGVYGAWAYGDATTYKPRLNTTGSSYADITGASNNRPIQVPARAGDRIYLRVLPQTTFPTPADLTLRVEKFQEAVVPSNPIFVPDDNNGLPAAIVDSATGSVVKFINGFPTGESAFFAAGGYVLVENEVSTNLKLYRFDSNYDFSLVATVAINVSTPSASGGKISGNKTDRFYVIDSAAAVVKKIELDGTISGSFSVSGGPIACAVSPDESILYLTLGAFHEVIKRYDIATGSALSDLATVPNVNAYASRQLLCLGDGSVVVGCIDGFDSTKFYVYRFSAAGALLNTYDFGSEPLATGFVDFHQIFHADDDPTSFWVWLKIYDDPSDHTGSNNAVSRYKRIKASDGSVLDTISPVPMYEIGIYNGFETATPIARFGHSNSCPALLLMLSEVTPTDPSVLCCCTCEPKPKKKDNRTLSAQALPSATGPILEAVDPLAWEPACDGGGSVPTAADATDAESWVS